MFYNCVLFFRAFSVLWEKLLSLAAMTTPVKIINWILFTIVLLQVLTGGAAWAVAEMAFLRQVRLILWKNFTLRKRQKVRAEGLPQCTLKASTVVNLWTRPSGHTNHCACSTQCFSLLLYICNYKHVVMRQCKFLFTVTMPRWTSVAPNLVFDFDVG